MIKVTKDELQRGTLSPEHLTAAVDAIETEGFVILNDVVDLTHLDLLHARLLEDLPRLINRPDAPFNWNTGNVQQDPPPFPPYLFADVLLNELVIDVATAVLGAGVKNSFYSGNTAMPSQHRQPVHADTGQLWPRLTVAHPPVQLVINIPTVDISPANGSTEIWPGTHLDVTIAAGKDIKVPPEVLEERRAQVPPIQPTYPRGSILIRDIRLWHAGMPNQTEHPRPMIALIYAPSWLETGTPLRFPLETKAFFEHPRLHTCARFTEEPIDHIAAPHAYEYDPEQEH